jgi:hypothetical protein
MAEVDINAGIFMATLMDGAPTTAGRVTTESIRSLMLEYQERGLRFDLRFQRKGVWKLVQKQAWIVALFRNVMTDPIAVSEHALEKRGINGGNRIRAIASFMNNEFSIQMKLQNRNYNMWWQRIPDSVAARSARFNLVMPADFQRVFLRKELNIHIREGLTERQEKDWYREMNKNMVSHKPGHLLIVQLCDEENVFAAALLRSFPILKARVDEPAAPEDDLSLYEFIAEKFALGDEQELKPNDDADTNEDVPLALARIFNMLATGSAYNHEFKGDFDGAQLARNDAKMREILDGFNPSPDMKLEMSAASSSHKKRLPNAYAPAYLLGPIAWSIGNDKPDVVNTWRRFLANITPGVIHDTYARSNNQVHGGDEAAKKYSFAWDAVQARIAALPLA